MLRKIDIESPFREGGMIAVQYNKDDAFLWGKVWACLFAAY